MKLVRTLALGAVLALSATTAGAQVGDSARKPAKAQSGAAERGWGRGMDREARAMFRGVDLTDTQKQQVKAIVDRYQPQRQALMQQMRDRRESGQRPDSAFTASIRQQRQALQERQVAEIRAVLTADQVAKFDANAAQARDRAAKRAEKMREDRAKGDRKGDRRGGRSN
jgi:protein CpxP